MHNFYLNQLQNIQDSLPNWDNKKSDPPNDLAINAAKIIIKTLLRENVWVSEVDTDVMGGIAIYCYNGSKQAWIACMNSGSITLALEDENNTCINWNNSVALALLKRFLD